MTDDARAHDERESISKTKRPSAEGEGGGGGERYRTVVLFVVAAVLFGTAFVGIKAGLTELPPVSFAALRYDVGASVLLGAVAVRGGYWRPQTRADYTGVVVAGTFLVAVNGALVFVGQQFTTSGAAAVLISLTPVVAPVFALVLLPGERLSSVGALGLVLGLFGVVIIVDPNPAGFESGGVGQVLVAVAAVSIAFGSVLLRRVAPPMPSLPMTAWAMAFGAIAVHGAGLALGESVGAVTPAAVGAVLYVGLFGTAGAFPAYFALIRRAGPVRANLVAYVVPVVAAVAGAVVLGERIAANTALGFLVIVVGFALIEREELAVEVRRIKRWLDERSATG